MKAMASWIIKSKLVIASTMFAAVLGIFVMTAQPVLAEVPGKITYQGYLRDFYDNPLNDFITMNFSIYDVETGGFPLWTETHGAVEVTDGIFSVMLGEMNPISEDVAEGTLYLGVAVENDEEMTPRQELTSVLFAIRAGVAESVVINGQKAIDFVDGNIKWLGDTAGLKGEKGDQGSQGSKGDTGSQGPQGAKGDTGSQGPQGAKGDTGSQGLQGAKGDTGSQGPKGDTGDSAFTLDGDTYRTDKNLHATGTISSGNSINIDGINDKITASSGKIDFDNEILTTNGRIGIGKSPNSLVKLDANGIIKSSPASVPGNFFPNFGKGIYMLYDEDEDGGDIGAIDAANYTFKKLYLSGKPVLINATNGGGNVGIGTDDPKAKLHVDGNVAIGIDEDAMHSSAKLHVGGKIVAIGEAKEDLVDFVNHADNVSADHSVIWLKYGSNNQPNNPMLIQASGSDGTDKFVVRNNGEVGIGTRNLSSTYKLYVAGNAYTTGSWGSSDVRWKKNITLLQDSLQKVSQLNGVKFDWKTDEYPDNGFSEDRQIGFIAQEVEPIIPELVSTDDNGYKSVSYEKMTAVLVEAVKELKAQNDALKAIVCEDHPEKAICQ